MASGDRAGVRGAALKIDPTKGTAVFHRGRRPSFTALRLSRWVRRSDESLRAMVLIRVNNGAGRAIGPLPLRPASVVDAGQFCSSGPNRRSGPRGRGYLAFLAARAFTRVATWSAAWWTHVETARWSASAASLSWSRCSMVNLTGMTIVFTSPAGFFGRTIEAANLRRRERGLQAVDRMA
jgi:hypothetical protein